MNPIHRVLNQELAYLLDRIAASVPEGMALRVATNPTLKDRLETAEAQLAAARAALLEDYGRWGKALEDLENLWALGAWRSAVAEEAAEQTSSLAA